MTYLLLVFDYPSIKNLLARFTCSLETKQKISNIKPVFLDTGILFRKILMSFESQLKIVLI